MKYINKRFIAIDLLVFASVVSLSIIFLFSMVGINFVINVKLNRLNHETSQTQSIVNDLEEIDPNKQIVRNQFFNEVEKLFDLTNSKYKTTDQLWDVLINNFRAGKVDYNTMNPKFVDFLKENNYLNEDSLNVFIERNMYSHEKDSVNNLINQYNNEIKIIKTKYNHLKNKQIADDSIKNNTLIFFVILLIITFPLRYFYYAIKWAINTLKKEQ